MRSVELPEGFTELRSFAFSSCTGLREVTRTVDGILIQMVLAKGEELSDHWELAIPRVKVDQLLEKWQLSQETWGDDTFLIIRPRT